MRRARRKTGKLVGVEGHKLTREHVKIETSLSPQVSPTITQQQTCSIYLEKSVDVY